MKLPCIFSAELYKFISIISYVMSMYIFDVEGPEFIYENVKKYNI